MIRLIRPGCELLIGIVELLTIIWVSRAIPERAIRADYANTVLLKVYFTPSREWEAAIAAGHVPIFREFRRRLLIWLIVFVAAGLVPEFCNISWR